MFTITPPTPSPSASPKDPQGSWASVKPAGATSPNDPIIKLDQLIKCINKLIRGYSNSPCSSTIYLSSLHSFRKRTEDLRIHLNSIDIDVSQEIVQAEIDKLENDWWSSEVVAAWYGPRPRRLSLSPNDRPIKRIQSELSMTPNERIIQAKPPSSSLSRSQPTNHGRSSPSPTKVFQRRKRIMGSTDLSALIEERGSFSTLGKGEDHTLGQWIEMEGWLRRDSSYVGLNDE
ncbi:uncharacterized protein IL334_002519 [Kwoniella shivajii]|uniref:Uncharacterized protein n=1 Tax=Kwoniella shivajii TaxID=564305 RepID=A0ABZ1CUZ2_9TREE|nr:hypothetical protein IL334_002519 [Kwoniella shivajii]